MKLSLITLYVENIEKTIKFYNEILEMKILNRQVIDEDNELVFLGNPDEVQLELVKTNEETTYQGFSIGFNVENLDKVKEVMVREGYPVIREFSPSPNITLCFIEGPNKETVELIEYK